MHRAGHLSIVALVVGGFSFLAISAQAQLVGPPPWSLAVASLQTTGGISYFTFTAPVLACDSIEMGPVSHAGATHTFSVSVRRDLPNCSCTNAVVYPGWDWDSDWQSRCARQLLTSTVVLGNLPAGTNQLDIQFPASFENPGLQVRTFSGEVPAAGSPPLAATREGDILRVAVSGVPAATYIVESSTNFTNWTPVFTNIGAPFSITTTVSNASAQFYRLSVTSGTAVAK